MFKTLAVSVLIVSTALGQFPTLSVTQGPIEIDTNFTVVCEISTNAIIRFLVDNNPVGSCQPDFLALDCAPKEIEQNSTKGLTSWTLAATLAYEGNWTCDQTLVPSNTEIVTMYKCPETIISETGIDSDLSLNGTASINITVKIGCIYPSNNPDIQLRFIPSDSLYTAPYKVLNCFVTTSACMTGSAYECTQEISFDMSLTDGSFSTEFNYTLHIDSVVLPLTDTCGRLALFEPHSLRFTAQGPKSTIEEPPTTIKVSTLLTSFIPVISRTSQSGYDSTADVPTTTLQTLNAAATLYTAETYSSTTYSSKQTAETAETISMHMTTFNASMVHEGQTFFAPLVISLSIGSFCLVVIAVVIICFATHKRRAYKKTNSGVYIEPEITSHEEHVYHGRDATNQKLDRNKNTEKSLLQSRVILNHEELSHDECRFTRRNLHDSYEKNFNYNTRVDKRLPSFEMAYVPHGYYRNEHYAFDPQTSRSVVLNDFYSNNDSQRREMMHQGGHNSSNFGFYRG